jgi:hypothetical protein
MNFSDALSVFGTFLGIAGLAYAIYQTTEKRKLEHLVRSRSWSMYSMANNCLGIAQAALNSYKNAQPQNQNSELLILLAKSDAFGQALFLETIRQIQSSESSFKRADVSNWVADGKIDTDKAKLFELLCDSDTQKTKS